MLQALLTAVDPIQNAIRGIFITFDLGIYSLLRFVYELFFNIATFPLLDRDMINGVFSKVQTILGIYMMFQLAMVIIKGIADPDSATNSKSGGAANVIVRIIVALSMLALIIPINVPNPKNEYEEKIKENGLLFGTLYSLQNRILSNNTLGKIFLEDDDTNNYTDGEPGKKTLRDDANRFTSSIVKTFYTLNTKKNDDGTYTYVCNDGFDETYKNAYVDPMIVIANGNQKCGSTWWGNALKFIADPSGIIGGMIDAGKQYRLNMNWISTVAGIIIVIVFFMMTFNVAKRVFKLAALQLIAPVPIISYMDPKGSKDGAFNSWIKLLSTTYLELFIQLSTIYFSFAMINMFIKKYFSLDNLTSSVTNAFTEDALTAPMLLCFTFIIMVIALFIFAKDAPKFFKQALGIKNDGEGFFSAFGTAMGLGTAAVGSIGSAKAGYNSSLMADKTRKALGENVNPDSSFNKAKHLLSGLFGGARGLATGTGAALSAKNHSARAAWDAMQKQNAAAIARGNDGSTLLGRLGSTVNKAFTGEGASGAMDREINTNKSRIDALKALQSRAKGEMVKQDWTRGALGIERDKSGNVIGKVNYKDFAARLAAGRANNSGVVTFNDVAGATHTIDIGDAEKQIGFLQKNNENDYIEQQINPDSNRKDVKSDGVFASLLRNAEVLGGGKGSSDFTRDADGKITKGDDKKITNRDDIWNAIEDFQAYNVQLGQQNALNKANDQHSGNK